MGKTNDKREILIFILTLILTMHITASTSYAENDDTTSSEKQEPYKSQQQEPLDNFSYASNVSSSTEYNDTTKSESKKCTHASSLSHSKYIVLASETIKTEEKRLSISPSIAKNYIRISVSSNGKPVANANVSLMNNNYSTDDSGAVSIPLPPVAHNNSYLLITASKEGYKRGAKWLHMTNDNLHLDKLLTLILYKISGNGRLINLLIKINSGEL